MIKKILYKIIGKVFFFFENRSWQYRYLYYRDKYTIAESFKFNGIGIVFYGDGHISIGENYYIGRFSSIQSCENCKVDIGNNCAISHYVKIYTMNRDPMDIIKNEKSIKRITGDVVIGNNCWIGANVFIKQGVIIGVNVVIGANSVVVKNINSNSIYAETKVIKHA